MHDSTLLVKPAITPEQENTFQMRFVREEGLGLLTTRSGKHYLLLDSEDYWYDAIQNRYPKQSKCGKCKKNDWFFVDIVFTPRKSTDDIRHIAIISRCSECGNEKKQLSFDVKTSPTAHLIETPLTSCEQPKLFYRPTKNINLVVTKEDYCRICGYLTNTFGLRADGWYWDGERRHLKQIDAHKISAILASENQRFLQIFFTRGAPSFEIYEDEEKGPWIDNLGANAPWRKQEILAMGSGTSPTPGTVSSWHTTYGFSFNTEFIRDGKVEQKSEAFTHLTEAILAWLSEELIKDPERDTFYSEQQLELVLGKKSF